MATLKQKKWRISTVISMIVISILALAMLFPLYYMFATSFMPEGDITKVPPVIFPQTFTLANYAELFKKPAVRWLFNSVFVSALTTVFTLIISSMAGYAFAKKRFVGREIIFFILIATIMVPKQIMIVPLFQVVDGLGLFNSHWGLIIPVLGWPIGIFMMRQFMSGVPTEILESARIDGCGETRTFLQIVIPLAKAGISALAIFTFVQSWNDYMWQLLVISSTNLKTLPLGVASIQEEFAARYGPQLAGAAVASLPMVLVFLAFQKYFTKGITMGAVKG